MTTIPEQFKTAASGYLVVNRDEKTDSPQGVFHLSGIRIWKSRFLPSLFGYKYIPFMTNSGQKNILLADSRTDRIAISYSQFADAKKHAAIGTMQWLSEKMFSFSLMGGKELFFMVRGENDFYKLEKTVDFQKPILSYRIGKNGVVVQFDDTVNIYNPKTFDQVGTYRYRYSIETLDYYDENSIIHKRNHELIRWSKLVSAVDNDAIQIIAFGSHSRVGYVVIRRVINGVVDSNTVEFKAHSQALQHIEISRDGRMVVTCGLKGTTVKMFSTWTGELLGSFRSSLIGNWAQVIRIGISRRNRTKGYYIVSVLFKNRYIHHHQVYDAGCQEKSLFRIPAFVSNLGPNTSINQAMLTTSLPKTVDLNRTLQVELFEQFENEEDNCYHCVVIGEDLNTKPDMKIMLFVQKMKVTIGMFNTVSLEPSGISQPIWS